MSHPVTNLRRLQSLARRPLGGLVLAAACFATFFPHAAAYGPAGHQTVGTVANRLNVGTPAGARVQALLGGDSLESAAAATCDLWATQITRRNLALGGYRLAAGRHRPDGAPSTARARAMSRAIWARRASRLGNFCSGRRNWRKVISRSSP